MTDSPRQTEAFSRSPLPAPRPGAAAPVSSGAPDGTSVSVVVLVAVDVSVVEVVRVVRLVVSASEPVLMGVSPAGMDMTPVSETREVASSVGMVVERKSVMGTALISGVAVGTTDVTCQHNENANHRIYRAGA